MLITTDCIYYKDFQNLTITDISDFKGINVEPMIIELQNYINNNIESIVLDKDVLSLPKKNAPAVLLNACLQNQKDEFLLLYIEEILGINYCLDKINVKYDDYCEYSAFNEYNQDADTVKTISEHENMEECLYSNNECNYIESYGYYVYLEIILKKKDTVDLTT